MLELMVALQPPRGGARPVPIGARMQYEGQLGCSPASEIISRCRGALSRPRHGVIISIFGPSEICILR
jgi:hypothetical protein